MSEIALPWDYLPTEPTGLSEHLGLTPEFIYLGSAPSHDWARNQPWTRASGVTETNTKYGRALDFSSSAANGLTRSGLVTSTQTRVTFGVVYQRTSSNQFAVLCSMGGKWSLGFDGGAISVGLVKNGVVGLNPITPLTASTVFIMCSHDTVTGEYWVMAADLDNSGASALYLSTQTDTNAQSAGDGSVSINTNGGANTFGGKIHAAFGGFGFVPQQKAAEIIYSPRLAFAEPRIWVPVSSGGAASPVAANATYYQMIAQQRIGY